MSKFSIYPLYHVEKRKSGLRAFLPARNALTMYGGAAEQGGVADGIGEKGEKRGEKGRKGERKGEEKREESGKEGKKRGKRERRRGEYTIVFNHMQVSGCTGH